MTITIPNKEAIKEIGRWLFFFVLSWIVTQTLQQANVIPEFYTLHISVLAYTVPLRAGIMWAFTIIGRYADKYVYVQNKLNNLFKSDSIEAPKGILPW